MAAVAASALAFVLSRVPKLPLRHFNHPSPLLPVSGHLALGPLLPLGGKTPQFTGRYVGGGAVCCLVSGVGGGGGGVSDDFVSTRKAGFEREFSVIAAMLKRIEPLDTSIISKGVSASAKDSMKQTISTMLGLLPSDQFSVTVRVSKRPLDSLLVSSIITGYTLWNAEYRTSLMKNFELSANIGRGTNSTLRCGGSEVQCEEDESNEAEEIVGGSVENLEKRDPQSLGDLSPEVVDYIRQMQSELSAVRKELSTQKQEFQEMENSRETSNNLLEYLRSLDADMVTELSQPSSLEVEEVIRQLVQSILQNFFKDDSANDARDSGKDNTKNKTTEDDGICDVVDTSRDYLAKLLFWCMLLGHHLRGLENRLHLTCVVGLL